MTFKILHIIGARPHYMKLAPIADLIQMDNDLTQVIVDTGQHFDHNMAGGFAKEFEIPTIKYNLQTGSESPLRQIGNQLIQLDTILGDEQPNIVFVYGDTNSTSAGAIAAAKKHLPLAHIEAGLREYDKSVPEEINKLLIDSVSDLHFCPTETGVFNLQKQGFSDSIHFVGDVVVDYILNNEHKIAEHNALREEFISMHENYVFMTCHRAANTDQKENLTQILIAANQIPYKVVFARHPRTKNAMRKYDLLDTSYSNIVFIEPQSFWQTQQLIRNAKCTLTDSGGIIKESYLHGTVSIIIDTQTEWMEIVNAGWSKICGPNTQKILSTFKDLEIPSSSRNLFQKGASEKIIAITKKYLIHHLNVKK